MSFAFLLPGPLEWIILGVFLLLIFLLIFGRLLGSTFRGFRRGLEDKSDDDTP